MLSDAVIASRVKRQRFMPLWRFSTVDGVEGLMLRIEAQIPNSESPGDQTDVRIDTYLPPMRDLEAVDQFVHWRLDRIMQHEVDEWHLVDGVPVERALHDLQEQNGQTKGTV